METTLNKKLTGRQMVELFEENSFIRYFETSEVKGIDEVHDYEITIRHPEDQEAEKILDEALEKI